MSALQTIRKLMLGETWVLPIGVAVLVTAAALIAERAGAWWEPLGGFLIAAGVVVLLLMAVARGAAPR